MLCSSWALFQHWHTMNSVANAPKIVMSSLKTWPMRYSPWKEICYMKGHIKNQIDHTIFLLDYKYRAAVDIFVYQMRPLKLSFLELWIFSSILIAIFKGSPLPILLHDDAWNLCIFASRPLISEGMQPIKARICIRFLSNIQFYLLIDSSSMYTTQFVRV